MTKIYRIPTGQVEGNGSNETNTSEIRPYGEIGLFIGDNNKLELLMFDGVRTHQRSKILNKGTFYGGDADSSDGLGYDTIKLVPDETLRRGGSQQYLIIEPTTGEPGHVHIRAGGAIDNSGADLFLGGEQQNVRVSDVNDRVSITTDLQYTWTFDGNGDLTFPGSSNAKISEDEPGLVVFSDNGFAILTNANTENSKSWVFEQLGTLRLPGNASVENTETVLAAGTIITVPLNAAGDTEDYVGGASTIEIPKNANTNQVQAGWIITFSNDVQRTITGVIDGGLYWSAQYADANPGLGSSTYPLTIQSADYNVGSDGDVTISMNNIDDNPIAFSFLSNGSIRLPNDALIAADMSNIELRNLANFNVEAEDVVNIYTDVEGTGYQWQFGDDGSLTIPGDIKSEGNINLDINLSDSTLRRWTFSEGGDLTLPAGGDIKDSSGNSVLSPVVQGEYTFDFDGVNTDVTLTEVNFNLLYASTALGYSGSDTHNINLPAGTPGQRLVIVNVSNFCTLTINNNQQITVASGPAEFIYSANDDWISLYGTV